jgi:hypothetical protein
MNFRKTIILPLLSLTFLVNAQVTLLKEIIIEGEFFTTDQLGNIYVSKGPSLTRLNNQGNMSGDFRSVLPGNISFVDASNPLQILLFYRDYNQIIFLDRNMTEKGATVFLNDLGIENAELVCTSARGGIWVLDWSSRHLNYFNQEFKLIFQTSLLGNLLDMDDTPSFMMETDGRLYISFPKTGIVFFDRSGSFESIFPILQVESFQKTSNSLLFFRENQPSFFSPENQDTKQLDLLHEAKIKSVRMSGNTLYVFTPGRSFLYRIL